MDCERESACASKSLSPSTLDLAASAFMASASLLCSGLADSVGAFSALGTVVGRVSGGAYDVGVADLGVADGCTARCGPRAASCWC